MLRLPIDDPEIVKIVIAIAAADEAQVRGGRSAFLVNQGRFQHGRPVVRTGEERLMQSNVPGHAFLE